MRRKIVHSVWWCHGKNRFISMVRKWLTNHNQILVENVSKNLYRLKYQLSIILGNRRQNHLQLIVDKTFLRKLNAECISIIIKIAFILVGFSDLFEHKTQWKPNCYDHFNASIKYVLAQSLFSLFYSVRFGCGAFIHGRELKWTST